MYSFLVLLPLTLISAALGALIIFSPQVGEYVTYVSTVDLESHRQAGRLPLQIAAHIGAFAIALFVLVATARTISTPVSRERNVILCRIQVILEAVYVAVPSVVLLALPIAAIAAPPVWLFWAATAVGAAGLAAIVFVWRPREFRSFQLAVTAIVAGVPIAVLAVLLLRSLASGSVGWLLTLTAIVGATGLIASVATVVLAKGAVEFFRSTLSPLSITMVDAMGAIALAISAGLVAVFMFKPVESANFLGIFPVLFMASTTFLMIVSVIFAKGSSPVAILSTLVSAIVVMHSVDGFLPTREFRYRSEIPAGLKAGVDGLLDIRGVTKARDVLEMREAFREWLNVRRPTIEAYRKKGRSYPVFIVAAQGGGIYAAYHSALSLARLYDRCPEFANHVFVLSGVSGGSLGSAVFAELVRSVPETLQNKPGVASEGCNPRPGAPKLEDKVKDFFTADFLSPVVDSAMAFDIPSLVVPWLRFGLDRAYALEYAFESAWRKAGVDGAGKYGMTASFYGRWKPDSPAPALMLSTTGVNYGIPVLVSQINWSQVPRLRLRSFKEGGDDDHVKDLLRRMQAQDERTRDTAIANILDFRPDLQVATSTAVGLSARFPYVTPPANITRSDKFTKPIALYEKIKVLELLDGAYFDNSGGWVAIDILEDLERYLSSRRRDDFKEFRDDIRFQLVRFTDRSAQRYGDASDDEHFELVTPLVAFNAVRLARGAQLRGVGELERTSESFIYLSDPWFLPPLNWVLSEATKRNIELRSGGPSRPESEVCCKAIAPPRALAAREARLRRSSPRDILMVADWDEAKKLNDLPEAAGWKVEQFVPNNEEAFAKLLTLVKDGDEPFAPPAQN